VRLEHARYAGGRHRERRRSSGEMKHGRANPSRQMATTRPLSGIFEEQRTTRAARSLGRRDSLVARRMRVVK